MIPRSLLGIATLFLAFNFDAVALAEVSGRIPSQTNYEVRVQHLGL
jgi:hypothetical protein